MTSRNTLVQIFICVLLESLVHPWMAGQSAHTWRQKAILMLIFPGAKIQWYLYGLLWWRFMNVALQHLPELYRFILSFVLAACPGFQLLGAAMALRSPGFTCRILQALEPKVLALLRGWPDVPGQLASHRRDLSRQCGGVHTREESTQLGAL